MYLITKSNFFIEKKYACFNFTDQINHRRQFRLQAYFQIHIFQKNDIKIFKKN